MKDYYAPDWWYEPECDYEPDCKEWVHVDDIVDEEVLREEMKKVLNSVYGDGRIEDLIVALDDICGLLNMRYDLKPLTVRKI